MSYPHPEPEPILRESHLSCHYMDTLHAPPTADAVSIPENSIHAVSVSLPSWASNVAYEESEPVLSAKIKSGYPRFKIHYKIEELVARLEHDYGREGERAMVFSTYAAARRCRDFIRRRHPDATVRVLQLSCPKPAADSLDVHIAVALFPADLFSVAKQYWQHTGEGVSSRHAQYFLEQLEFEAEEKNLEQPAHLTQPQEIFVEERFGRYLSTKLASEAKPVLKTRISREISRRGRVPVTAENVYLYPSGMTAIFSAYRAVMAVFDSDNTQRKAVCFGFPYTDTLKVLQKWGPGAIFFPQGDDNGDLVELERQLRAGEISISCVMCEVPSNPLLCTPNLKKLRALANEFKFAIVVDDTVGNLANIDTISYSDISVSSLTKLFSGDCNVMAGDLVLNVNAPFFADFDRVLREQYVDALWAEDAIYLERNSRDFYDRNQRINANAAALVDLLVNAMETHPSKLIKNVYYPKVSPSKPNYDAIKYEDGGYGGLLSIVFHSPQAAIAFFDTLYIAKGPSLGTNFTLGCPYTIIAHFNELDFVNSCGVDTYLVRISIGLEERAELIERFKIALDAAEHAATA